MLTCAKWMSSVGEQFVARNVSDGSGRPIATSHKLRLVRAHSRVKFKPFRSNIRVNISNRVNINRHTNSA